MIVTITNVSSGQVFLSTHYVTLAPAATVQVVRTAADIDADVQLKALVLAGSVTLSFTEEASDAVVVGFGAKVLEYTDATRPAATTMPSGTMIWNTSDSAPNFSDGTNWRDASGNLT